MRRYGGRRLAALPLIAALLPMVAIVLGATTARAAGHAQSNAVSFLRRDYDVQIQRNGDVTVAERWQLRFSGGPYTSATLGVFLTHTESVDFGQVVGANADSEQVARVEDAQKHLIEQISWTFPPAQDATRTFTIPYTLRGAIGQNATQAWLDHHFFDGPGRGNYTGDATQVTQVTVTLPAAASGNNVQTKVSYPGAQLQTSRPSDTTVLIQGQNLTSEQLLEIAVIFPRGLLDASAPKPAWQHGNTPPEPPTALDVDRQQSDVPEPSGGASSFLGNIGLVFAIGLAVLAILGLVAWRLSRRLAADIRKLAAIEPGAGLAAADEDIEDALPAVTRPLPAIDVNFGEVAWPKKQEELDLQALGLHPLEEGAAGPISRVGVQWSEHDDGHTEGSPEGERGTGATSDVGSGDGE